MDKERNPFYFKIVPVEENDEADILFEGGNKDILYPITCFYTNSETMRKLKRYAKENITEGENQRAKTLMVGARDKQADRQRGLARRGISSSSKLKETGAEIKQEQSQSNQN